METKDLFSSNASDYSKFRPDYPIQLFDFIFDHIRNFDSAWDCGTGNGQAAKFLSEKFLNVHATDISDKQMEQGYRANNIHYSICPAEQTTFSDNQFDLITVAQAAHWFKLDGFYSEVNRVASENSFLAIWGYGLLSVNPEFDISLNQFYKQVVGPYWDTERVLIDNSYSTIPFPFNEISVPDFHFIKEWDIARLAGYLSTWSAVQKFIQMNAFNPVDKFIDQAELAFGNGIQKVSFPLFSRFGSIP